MENSIKWLPNRLPRTDDRYLPLLAAAEVERACRFQRSFPQYNRTALAALPALAGKLGVGGLYVKDESTRYGLGSFKVLGASYAIGRYIAQMLGEDISAVDYARITSPEVAARLGRFTFFSTTDGNHGRAVAWAANKLGQRAVIRMPQGSSKERFDNIAAEGAEVTIENMNYDDCVRLTAAECAKTPNSVVVQDTAWAGYEEIPQWIIEGYAAMAAEAEAQLAEQGAGRPTHVVVQAGVGSFASAAIGYFANKYPDAPPVFLVVEPHESNCYFRTAEAGDGEMRAVGGEMRTIMAGLACGEPNPISYDIIRNHAALFVSVPDYVSANGMRTLASPLAGDARVCSGESGAVGLGLLRAICSRPELAALRAAAGLDENARVLCFSTEGDTDRARYERIVWNGACPDPDGQLL